MSEPVLEQDHRRGHCKLELALYSDDDCFGPGSIRPDGRKLHPAYLFEVKKPEESAGPWDLYRLVATVPAADAARPLTEGGCPLVRAN